MLRVCTYLIAFQVLRSYLGDTLVKCIGCSTSVVTYATYRSLLSMDTDGRVIRIDSVSKFIAP
jgi:hypothetical protein